MCVRACVPIYIKCGKNVFIISLITKLHFYTSSLQVAVNHSFIGSVVSIFLGQNLVFSVAFPTLAPKTILH